MKISTSLVSVSLIFLASSFFLLKEGEPLYLKKSKTTEVIKLEKSINSEVINEGTKPLTKTMVQENGQFVEKLNPRPLLFLRKSNWLIPLYTEYWYNLEDSVINGIYYDWDKYKGLLLLGRPNGSDKVITAEDLNKEYEKIRTLVIKDFKKPTSEDDSLKTEKSFSNPGKFLYKRAAEWKFDDYTINLSLMFSEKKTERIRLHVKFK